MLEIHYAKAVISWFYCHPKIADARAIESNESFGLTATLHHKLESHMCKLAFLAFLSRSSSLILVGICERKSM